MNNGIIIAAAQQIEKMVIVIAMTLALPPLDTDDPTSINCSNMEKFMVLRTVFNLLACFLASYIYARLDLFVGFLCQYCEE